jgi:chromosome segregation ATPase
LLRIGSTVENLSTGQQALQDKAVELLALHQTVLSSVTDLPDSMAAVVKAAQLTQTELLAHTVTRKEFEDVVRERISSVESERDLLRSKVDDIQAVMLLRATDAATAQARTTELEEALSRSLARLKTSDVTIESQQERLLELEKLNRELTSEKQALISKVSFIKFLTLLYISCTQCRHR